MFFAAVVRAIKYTGLLVKDTVVSAVDILFMISVEGG
jgi:hypothetical protein